MLIFMSHSPERSTQFERKTIKLHNLTLASSLMMMASSDEDEQWASLTRSIYTQNTQNVTDDTQLRQDLCKAYGSECRKRHILNPSADTLYEAELWELAGRLSPLTTTTMEERVSSTMESYLQEAVPSRVMALKEWLEECQPAYCPVPIARMPATDLDSHPQQTDADSLRCAESVFKLLRKGKLEEAIVFFKQSGSAWKAAVMSGGRYDRPNQDRQQWRQAVERLVLRETSWEAAWLGVLVGQLAPAVKVLRSTGQYSWRDAVWLNCVSLIDRACEQVLAGSCPTLHLAQVFAGIDAPKDRFYYACKAIFMDTCEFIEQPRPFVGDDRLSLHLSLVIGGDVSMADTLLSEWILSKQTHIYSIWYLSLLSTFDGAADLLAVILANSMQVKSRRSIVYAANEAGLREVVVKAADIAIGTIGCSNAIDLLTVTTTDAAIRRINEHARTIIGAFGDWRQATGELSAFFSIIPDTLLSASTLDELAQQQESIVAEIATFMHLCRLGTLYKELQAIRSTPPTTTHHTDFGAAAKFAERSEQAWRLRLSTIADSFIASAEELLNDGTGAWWSESVMHDPFMQRLRASYAPALRDAITAANGAK